MPGKKIAWSKVGRPLAVVYRAISELVPYANNARRHSRAQIRKIARSLEKFGWTNPILIDELGNVLCGHGRLEAALLNGETIVPTISLGEMNDADRRAYILADNRLAEEAEWSKAMVRSELSGLIDLGYDIELTGFDVFEIDGILNFDSEEPSEENVELGPEGAVPVSRVGDHWKIGGHGLVVGDGRYPSVSERLLAGEKARMVITDPPYGNRIRNNVSGNGEVVHDDFVMGSGEVPLAEFAETLLRPAFEVMAANCATGAIAFVFTDWRALPFMFKAAQGIFHEAKNLVAWVKNPGMGGFYRSAHELCYVFKVSPGPHVSNIKLGQRNRTNVWRYPSVNTFRAGRLQDLADHPTVKPTDCFRDAILDVSRPGDIVLDPFAGSGTTALACEKAGRRARLIELDPKYADVILRRVAEATGCEPLLDGLTPLSEVAAARAGDAA